MLQEKIPETIQLDTEEMAKAGLHFGHRVSKLHPKMKPYIYGVKNTIHLIDLDKSALKFKAALEFIKNLIAKDKVLLLVGTKIQVKEIIKKIGEELHLPYVNERWLGGTFTNFGEIKKRIDYFKDLKKKKEEGLLKKYTKKERMKIEKELPELEKKFKGLQDLFKLPDAVFICDMKEDQLSCKEAKMKGIKVIGIADTNIDPGLADFPIPANDDAINSLKYILDKVKIAIQEGQKIRNKEQETGNKKQENEKD